MDLTGQLHEALDALYASVNTGDNEAFAKDVEKTDRVLALYDSVHSAGADALEHKPAA